MGYPTWNRVDCAAVSFCVVLSPLPISTTRATVAIVCTQHCLVVGAIESLYTQYNIQYILVKMNLYFYYLICICYMAAFTLQHFVFGYLR